jgi:helix-turn-helix protein
MAQQLRTNLARAGLLERGEFVDVGDAARILHVSESFLNKARLDGTGPPFCKFGKAVRYELAALQAWTASRTRTSTSDNAA